ncbi:MAG: DUF2461 domain-containing protein [Jatrophihabitantaceae bacterium]
MGVPTSFIGFPSAAFDFYDDLEADNSKTFWEANKQVYADAVRAPMVALIDRLAAEFGTAKIFRPYRDVRFAADRTPYKTHQGAFVEAAPATGWYVEMAASGFRVAVGFYHASTAGLAAVRTAIDGPLGAELETIVTRMRRGGWQLGGEQLKTAPRGFGADHSRIELLRHKSMTLSRSYGFDAVVHTPALVTRVRRDWRAGRSFVEWMVARLDGTS